MDSSNLQGLFNNKGLKRPGNNEEALNQRLIQRPRTSYDMAISRVSSQVNNMRIEDNDYMELGEPNRTNNTFKEALNQASEIASQASPFVDVVANFVPFGGLISSIYKAGEEIISLYQKAEHNRDICSHMTKRVIAAMAAVKDLKTRKSENERFFTNENLILFRGFVECMWKIRDYIAEISQLGRMRQILKGNMIEQKFMELTEEFEGYMESLQFSIIVQSNLDLNTELQAISKNVRELKELLSHHGGITDARNHISPIIPELLNRNINFQNQQRIRGYDDPQQDLEQIEILDLSLYTEILNVTRRNVTKRLHTHGDEVAFKEFTNKSSEVEKEIRQQVAILQDLKESGHIVKFYGIVRDGFKYFLVTEWMDNGNLLEYYRCHPFISWQKKLDFAVDICRGLIFLNAIQILHRDLRGANILVDKNHKAKIANFGLSRRFTELTRNIQASLETVKYMAPEKLNKGEKHPYDVKCEIYSLGALLWEIAEQKMPFSDKNMEFQAIRDLVVKSRYREPLSDEVPDPWKKVVNEAFRYSPVDRPPISKIFESLYQCQSYFNLQLQPQPVTLYNTNVIDVYESESDDFDIGDVTIENSGFVSVQEAISEHKKGNKQAAWKSFCHHAENGDMEAKFWVGCYLYYSELDELKHNKEENLAMAAQLFKETADNGKTEAQLKYGSCLWLGKGVRINYNEAIKYLTRAADNGNANAMYNVGSAYFNGKGVPVDRERGLYYLREAARRQHPKSIEMCRNCGIDY